MARQRRRRYPRAEEVAEHPYRVLLPLANLQEAQALLPVAEALIRDRQGELIVLHVVEVPEGQSLSEAAASVSEARLTADRFLANWDRAAAPVRVLVRAAYNVWDEIWAAVAKERVDLLLLGQSTSELPETTIGTRLDSRLGMPPCAVVVVQLAADVNGPAGWKAARRILLPVHGGPNSGLALRVAHALAEAFGADVTLLHATERETPEAQTRWMSIFGPALRNLHRLTRAITAISEAPPAIIAESDYHEVVVMGAASRDAAADGWTGPVLDRIIGHVNANTTLIVVKEPPAEPAIPEVRPTAMPELHDRPISLVVDKWFAENTFRSTEFADIERLVELKQQQGVTISLGLPALNEEKTVGQVISTVKQALMDQFPLLDEIVLIDSGSVDYTREIAMDLGIPVYIHQEILPQYGAVRGKGEALWKSLYVLKGDIVVWIDTDITNIHPRFVYGVVGPLLYHPHLQYVKGFYRRPLRQGEKLVAGGGGRVTELTARPLLNLFFPELSGLIQPLAGEYAGRRQALEQVPFFTGYGVETGLLIDILDRFGLFAIGQTDLRKRIHHNQPLPSLSKMSFAIIQVVIRRLEDRHKLRLLEEINKTMNLIRYEPGRYYLETEEIRERERPPMITIPEYRQKRGLSPAPAQADLGTRDGSRPEGSSVVSGPAHSAEAAAEAREAGSR